MYETTISTPIGTMNALCDEHAILALDFTDDVSPIYPSHHQLLLRLKTELDEYFAGNRNHFTLPLAPSGTPFQQQTWKILQTIPYRATISYAQEAILSGNPKATRAVANANGKNPISILIPCHRVIATGGGMGGYSGGLWRKEFLLELEKESLSF